MLAMEDIYMLESYGLSKTEYRRNIEDVAISAKMLSKKVIRPKRVYRYRRLGYVENGNWVENSFWEDDVNGICMFSVPNSFNKNDNDECKVRFDNDEVFMHMFPGVKRPDDEEINEDIDDILNLYKDSLQTTMKVGCFTTVKPLSLDMWNDPNFGDDGHGICIEYKIDKENFYPDELAFLPILYDDKYYDNTPAMKYVVDFAKDNDNQNAASGMVCLGYGHTLIKPMRYEKEQEWRLVIPIRDDGAHLNYFNVNHDNKRDMSSAISGVYLGPKFQELDEYEKYKKAIIERWKNHGINIYQIIDDEGVLKAVEITCRM